MKQKEVFVYAIGSYACFATGLATAFFLNKEPIPDWQKIVVALYWAYLCSCVVFLAISALIYQRALFPKLTTYFQIWGTLGTFGGLMMMCDSVASAVKASDTTAVVGALAGFSPAVITSVIGMVLALCNDMLPEEEEIETGAEAKPEQAACSTPAPLPASPAIGSQPMPITQPAVPQTVVYQAVMPPITTAAPVSPQASGANASTLQTPGKGGNDNGTP